jgi:hypothetical protein
MNEVVLEVTMKDVSQLIQKNLDKMASTGMLFRSSITGNEVWEMYINGFENDPVFRDPESSEHNCNLCKNFIRRYGNIVTISDKGDIITMFDLNNVGNYQNSFNMISSRLKSAEIKDVFFETFNELNSLPYESCKKSQDKFKLGIDKNVKRYTKEEAEKFGVVQPNEVRTFHHLHVHIPKEFVDTTGKSVEAIMAEYRDKYFVFKRCMQEISLDILKLVRDLINQGSLLDGTSHLEVLEQIIFHKTSHDEVLNITDNWYWETSYTMSERLAKFKNTLIGVLCTELSEGEDLNKACLNWNKRVDPANYMKATAPITKRQIEEAKKFVQENDYEESFNRRFALLDDIKVSEILHSNVGDGKVKTVSIFDNVKSTTSKKQNFENVEEIAIEKFMSDVLPSCDSIEAYLENRMQGNLVTLTTANNPESKPIFKWSNNYSWTYNGNLAGKSLIKQTVKDLGGNVEGVLNFRLAWNESGQDNSDLDLWAIEPNNNKIGFSTSYRKDRGGNIRTPMSGQLDVDITSPRGKLAVENITWTDINKMKNGIYKVYVNPYRISNTQGFKMEIEFDGNTYSYFYDNPVRVNVNVAEITLNNGQFSIKHLIPESGISSKELWGLNTNQFHKVNLVCLSPNHWEDSVGNKHYFFMLDGCYSDVSVRSFHNENLIQELLDHRKVMEVLGSTNMLEPTKNQLAGLGFNATIKDELIVKCTGSFNRILKIKF